MDCIKVPHTDSVETFSVQCVAGWSARGERSAKIGHVVEIALIVDIPSANQHDKTMNGYIMIPEGYRPTVETSIVLVDNTNNVPICGFINPTTGSVYIYRTSTATCSNLRLHAMYTI